MFYSCDQVQDPSWVSRKYVAFPCVSVGVCVCCDFLNPPNVGGREKGGYITT